MGDSETEFISIQDTSSSEGGSTRQSGPLPDTVPVLGLSDIVIYPGMVAPLLVDTAESIQLIDDVVGGNRLVALALQKDPELDSPAPKDLYTHACVAKVLKMLKFPDNTVRVLVQGVKRATLGTFKARKPYLKAKVRYLNEPAKDSPKLTALYRGAREIFEEITNLSPGLNEQVKVAAINIENPARLADLIAANLNIDLEQKQDLLATPDVVERLTKLMPFLNREREVLNIGSRIQQEVAENMSRGQRDVFLREQIRALQRELGESDPSQNEIMEFQNRIDETPLSEEALKVANKELERLQQTPTAVAEYTVIRNYLEHILSLPWDKSTTDKIDFKEASRILDEQHFGLEKVKDRLLEYLAVLKMKGSLRGPILCLAGPPGVGKTSLASSLAKALGRKFVRMALGGVKDEAEIRGHRRTYIGAMPGRILQAYERAETNNPVLLLDEIDKLASDFRGDPASALLEVLDPEQNQHYTDHYLDLPFDLSKTLFIATANWLDPIHPALKDRMEIIELPSYTRTEKLEIATRHLVPRQLEQHGLKRSQLKLPKATLAKLIDGYTREAGCRQLEREIASLTRKSVRKIVSSRGRTKTVKVQPQDLNDFLGTPRFHNEMAEKITDCGIVIGLAWTPVGGDILFIEATKVPGKGKLILTGSLGDVMKESAQTAHTLLRSHADSLGLTAEVFDTTDVHIHVPAGATPKDGPSAGVTIFTALASLFTGRRSRSDLAMTGEISLRGRVLPVGGIKEKVLAAHRSGIKRILLSEDNKKDWQEVPEETRKRLKVSFVRNVLDVLPEALLKK